MIKADDKSPEGELHHDSRSRGSSTASELREAFRRYRAALVAPSNPQEAERSRQEIEDIVTKIVPEEELLESQVRLALKHLDDEPPLLRQERRQTDEEWDEVNRERGEVEINRRVHEKWRGPY